MTRSLTIHETHGNHPNASMDLVDEGDKTRLRVREPTGKASIYLTGDQLDMLATEIRIRRAHSHPAVVEFRECEACAAKPGSPDLCAACLRNRFVRDVEDALNKAREEIAAAAKAEIDQRDQQIAELEARRHHVEARTDEIIADRNRFAEELRVANEKLAKRRHEAWDGWEEQYQAMRACIVYARDRRGGLFDFDEWNKMVEFSLRAGFPPPHALEDAQTKEAQAWEAVSSIRKERDDLREQLRFWKADHHHRDEQIHQLPIARSVAHDDLPCVDTADTLERIYCPMAGQLLHHGCGWCAHHNRPSYECFCNGQRVTVRASDLPAPRCEDHRCRLPAVHGEHWYDKMRWWCEQHVPMSGHYENCPESCRHLVKRVTRPELFADLALLHAHLRGP